MRDRSSCEAVSGLVCKSPSGPSCLLFLPNDGDDDDDERSVIRAYRRWKAGARAEAEVKTRFTGGRFRVASSSGDWDEAVSGPLHKSSHGRGRRRVRINSDRSLSLSLSLPRHPSVSPRNRWDAPLRGGGGESRVGVWRIDEAKGSTLWS